MRKALQITAFLLVLGFLLYLVPPVRNFVNTSFQAQVGEFVQLESCGCTEESTGDFCFTKWVEAGTCPTNLSNNEFFSFESPSIQCQIPGEVMITYVNSLEECTLEFGGTVVDGSETLTTDTTNNNIGFVTEKTPAESEALVKDLENAVLNAGLGGDTGGVLSDGGLKEKLEEVVIASGLGGETSSDEIGPLTSLTGTVDDPSGINVLPPKESLPEGVNAEDLITFGPSGTVVLVGGSEYNLSDPASVASLKELINEKLDLVYDPSSNPINGIGRDYALDQLKERLELEEVSPELEELLKDCIRKKAAELYDGGFGGDDGPEELVGGGVGSAPEGGGATPSTPSGGAVGGFTAGGTLLVTPIPGAGSGAGGTVIIGGQPYDFSDPNSPDFEKFKKLVDDTITDNDLYLDPARGTDFFGIIEQIAERLGLPLPLSDELYQILYRCLQKRFAEAYPDNVILLGEPLNLQDPDDLERAKEIIRLKGLLGAILNPEVQGLLYDLVVTILEIPQPVPLGLEKLIKECLQMIYNMIEGSPAVVEGPYPPYIPGEETDDPDDPDDPEDPYIPYPPEGGDPPTGDPPPPPPPLCPNCPGLHLWDAGAAHDGGVPTHYEWDGPHFHVGRLNPNTQTQKFIKIEEPVVWLGQGDKRVDGEIEPHCCDDENASIDQDGLIHAKSNQDGVTVYLDHIVGAAANPANPLTTHLGTLIISRYERRGSQNYDFFVIDAMKIRTVGEKYVAVDNNPLRTNPDLLKGEGWLRVIYMAADEENYGFKVEEIEDDWDGTHSKLMEIINLPALDPLDPTIPPGEIEDYWYGEDCGGNFGFYDPMRIPSCDQTQDIVVEPSLDDKLNITFICTQTQSQTCGNDNTGGAGTFGGGNTTAANNGPLGEYLVNLLKAFKADPANNNPKNRLELMYQALIAILPAVGNNPTP